MKIAEKKLRKAIRAEYNSVRQLLRGNPDMKFALMIDNYGPFKRHKSYEVCEEGYDWARLKSKGKSIYVGTHLIHPNPFEFLLDQDDLEDEQDTWQNEDLLFTE